MVSRSERRRELKNAVEGVSRRGYDMRVSESEQTWSVMAAARILFDILRGHGAMRASAAAKWAHDLFETSLKNNPTEAKIECAKGCAFCCHLGVSATAPEVFLIANRIRETHKTDLENYVARLRETERRTREGSALERARRRIPCALLDGSACSVYDVRPGPCRGLTSISARTCERGFNGENVQVTTPGLWATLRAVHLQALWAALIAAELPANGYELNQAICVALETPDAESRWLKGEDVFAGVARMRDAAALDRESKRVLDMTVAGALGKELPPSR